MTLTDIDGVIPPLYHARVELHALTILPRRYDIDAAVLGALDREGRPCCQVAGEHQDNEEEPFQHVAVAYQDARRRAGLEDR